MLSISWTPSGVEHLPHRGTHLPKHCESNERHDQQKKCRRLRHTCGLTRDAGVALTKVNLPGLIISTRNEAVAVAIGTTTGSNNCGVAVGPHSVISRIAHPDSVATYRAIANVKYAFMDDWMDNGQLALSGSQVEPMRIWVNHKELEYYDVPLGLDEVIGEGPGKYVEIKPRSEHIEAAEKPFWDIPTEELEAAMRKVEPDV
jgi:hypothetical protein